MRVLLVEDDPMIGKSVQQGLRQDGHTVDWVRDGRAAELALATTPYELLLLDLGLPGKSGLERSRPAAVRPTTHSGAGDHRPRCGRRPHPRGLDSGADDYLVKPFDLDELSARMRAVLRRHAGRASPVIETLGDLRMNPATHELTQDGKPVALSAREFALLQALLEQPGVPLSRARLEERLYGWGEEIESNASRSTSTRCGASSAAERIKNIRGVGYLVPACLMRSIRRQLLLALLSVITLTTLLGALATYRTAREEANAMFDYQLRQLALSFATRSSRMVHSTTSRSTTTRRTSRSRSGARTARGIYLSHPATGTTRHDAAGLRDDRHRRWQVARVRHAAGWPDDPGRATDAFARRTGAGRRLANRRTVPAHAADTRGADLGGRRPRPAPARRGRASGQHAHPVALDPLPENRVPTEVVPLVRR
jgi:two-component system response regulator QseB